VLFIAGGVNFAFVRAEHSYGDPFRLLCRIHSDDRNLERERNSGGMPGVQLIRPSVANRRISGQAGDTIQDAIQARVSSPPARSPASHCRASAGSLHRSGSERTA
jgi:hypothetical protein